jgi:hypothetical protein
MREKERMKVRIERERLCDEGGGGTRERDGMKKWLLDSGMVSFFFLCSPFFTLKTPFRWRRSRFQACMSDFSLLPSFVAPGNLQTALGKALSGKSFTSPDALLSVCPVQTLFLPRMLSFPVAPRPSSTDSVAVEAK